MSLNWDKATVTPYPNGRMFVHVPDEAGTTSRLYRTYQPYAGGPVVDTKVGQSHNRMGYWREIDATGPTGRRVRELARQRKAEMEALLAPSRKEDDMERFTKEQDQEVKKWLVRVGAGHDDIVGKFRIALAEGDAGFATARYAADVIKAAWAKRNADMVERLAGNGWTYSASFAHVAMEVQAEMLALSKNLNSNTSLGSRMDEVARLQAMSWFLDHDVPWVLNLTLNETIDKAAKARAEGFAKGRS